MFKSNYSKANAIGCATEKKSKIQKITGFYSVLNCMAIIYYDILLFCEAAPLRNNTFYSFVVDSVDALDHNKLIIFTEEMIENSG